jgi:hypothetical protein
MNRRKSTDPAKKKEDTIRSNAPLQGEGNYTAGRRYDQLQQEFVKSGRVDESARRASAQSSDERQEMEEAEQKGLRHARK